MRRTTGILSFFALGALIAGVVACPVLAGQGEPTGDQLGIYQSGAKGFPASTPFFISHGYSFAEEDVDAVGRYSFTVELDGELLVPSFVDRAAVDDGPSRTWVFNFPDGLTGTHVFAGHWYAPCGAAPAYLDCGDDQPNTPVEDRSSEVTVTFTD